MYELGNKIAIVYYRYSLVTYSFCLEIGRLQIILVGERWYV